MPTYDYECRSCGHRFEAFQSMSDNPLVTCPECNKDELKRLIGGGLGIIFKGSGFYVNDSRKAGTASSGSKKTVSTPTGSSSSGSSSSGSSGDGKASA